MSSKVGGFGGATAPRKSWAAAGVNTSQREGRLQPGAAFLNAASRHGARPSPIHIGDSVFGFLISAKLLFGALGAPYYCMLGMYDDIN